MMMIAPTAPAPPLPVVALLFVRADKPVLRGVVQIANARELAARLAVVAGLDPPRFSAEKASAERHAEIFALAPLVPRVLVGHDDNPQNSIVSIDFREVSHQIVMLPDEVQR